MSGILYLHRISDPRMGGISRRNFNMFRKLCGDETLKNVLIVTTMWGLVDPKIGETREEQLKTYDNFFKPVLDKGARMARHDNTRQCAQDLVRMIMKNHPQALHLQRELVDEGKDITETSAGEEIGREIAELVKKHKSELQEVQDEMREALAHRDLQTKKELEEYDKKLRDEMKKAETEMGRLKQEYAAEKKRADERLASLTKTLNDERSARLEGQKLLDKLQADFEQNKRDAELKQAEMKGQIEGLRSARGSTGSTVRLCVIQ